MTQGNRTCRQCGRKIDSPPYQRAGSECCCEGCFLGSRQWRTAASIDAEHHAFAEALAAALEAFLAEERVLREMVAVKCATEWSAVP